MLGSLKEFIDSRDPEINYSPDDLESEKTASNTKYSRKKMLEDRKKKSRVVLSEYIPSDKKLLYPSLPKKILSIEPTTTKSFFETERTYITGRKPINQSRISSMFHGTNTMKIPEDEATEK